MPEKENSGLLTKNYFESALGAALEEYPKSIIEAVDFGFEKAKEDRLEMKKDIQDMKAILKT